MKFKIFSLLEKCYKIVTAIVVIGVTIGCFAYYDRLNDKSDTFIIATVYAAFLFIVGLFLSYMSNSISNKLYERKDEYIMLKRLNEIFSTSCMTSLNTYRDICFSVISFQAFSGRTKEYVSGDEKKKAIAHVVPLEFTKGSQPLIDNKDLNQRNHYIKEIGFKYEPKLEIIEDSYTKAYYSLKKEIQDNINTYIVQNNIELNIKGGFFELDLLGTNYEDWCKESISDNSSEKQEDLIEYIYNIINQKQEDFNKLEEKKKDLVKYYKKCHNRIQRNLKRMNHTYGNRLEFVINTKEDVLEELRLLLDRVEKIGSDIDSKVSESIEIVDGCDEKICGIYSKLQDLYEDIVSEIQVDIIMLEEDLGVEFDKKEKFNELIKRHEK